MNTLRVASIIVMLHLVGGCAVQSGVLMERKTKGRIVREEKQDKDAVPVRLEPVELSQTKDGVEILVRYAAQEYLDDYFKDKIISGIKVKENPYPPDSIVFYTFIKNTNRTKIKLCPDDFVILDDLGNQYALVLPEHIIALQSSRLSLHSVSKSAEQSTPGVYGAPVKIVAELTSRPLKRKLSVLKQVSLSGGYIYGGVNYEGYAAFPRLGNDVKRIRLVMPDVKTEFAADDRTTRSTDFVFEFEIKTR